MGDKGEEVKRLQNLLISKGYSCGPAGADSDFGQGTYNAVVAFQRDHGLEQDGVVGNATWGALDSSSGSGTSGSSSGGSSSGGSSSASTPSSNGNQGTSMTVILVLFGKNLVSFGRKHLHLKGWTG